MKFHLPLSSYKQFEVDRKKALQMSDCLRIESKAAISYLLKGMEEGVKKTLKKADGLNKNLQKLLQKTPYLHSVGGVHSGTEEYVEAKLLHDYLLQKSLSTQEELNVHHESYLGGLCDLSGELLRLARRDPSRMKQILDDISELFQTFLEVVVTRNAVIRKKSEDLERNMKKIEEMIFEYQLKRS